MANKELQEAQFLNRAIPGESLTSDPENPAPWETPPEVTDPAVALGTLSETLMKPKNMAKYMKLIRDDVPITQIAKTILFAGFASGKITPDMQMLLLKPISMLLLMLAERAGIDPVLYPGDISDMSLEDELQFIQELDEEDVAEIIQEDEAINTPEEGMENAENSLLSGGGMNG